MKSIHTLAVVAALVSISLASASADSVRITANQRQGVLNQPVEFTVHTDLPGQLLYQFQVKSPTSDQWVDREGRHNARQGQQNTDWTYRFDQVGTWKVRVMVDRPGATNRFAEMDFYVHDGQDAQGGYVIRVHKIRPSTLTPKAAEEMSVNVRASGGTSQLVYRLYRMVYVGGRYQRRVMEKDWTPGGHLPFIMDNAANDTGLKHYMVEIRQSSGGMPKVVHFQVFKSAHRHNPRGAWAEADLRVDNTSVRDLGRGTTHRVGHTFRCSARLSDTHEMFPPVVRFFAVRVRTGSRPATDRIDYLNQPGANTSTNWSPRLPGRYFVGVEITFARERSRRIYTLQEIEIEPARPTRLGKPRFEPSRTGYPTYPLPGRPKK